MRGTRTPEMIELRRSHRAASIGSSALSDARDGVSPNRIIEPLAVHEHVMRRHKPDEVGISGAVDIRGSERARLKLKSAKLVLALIRIE
ncbi:hypothetical protein D3C72_1702940 [compost metagenome]